uniref:Uncharacterized protein n=1 Tax=Anguilla anguilla TaxID=7936 RepID=A0A0E9RIS7_ANGAN
MFIVVYTSQALFFI